MAGGTFTGSVVDQNSGEALIGANILILETKRGAMSDIEGKFRVQKIPAGMYDVRVSFIGYETKLISGVEMRNNEVTSLAVSLSEDQGIIQREVVINATAIRSGEGAMLVERRKASSIGDGISAEQMRKAPDATSGDALKRVTGISVVDNKYVFVRGVTDRYNQTMLNGASVTSTSVDKKSFSFDMLPSNLIENMNVAKTASPDLPGDFTGGLVQLNTMDFPERRSMKFVYSGGINSVTTFNQFNRTIGGKNDWLGSDDGSRIFPDAVKSPAQANRIGTDAPNSFAPRTTQAPINQSISLSTADVILLDEIENSQFGYLAAVSYKNNFQRTNSTVNDFTGTIANKSLSGVSDRFSVLWGGILDVNFKLDRVHKLSFKNNYNRSAEDRYNIFEGSDFVNQQYTRSYQNEWEERSMMSNQIGGEHLFPEISGISVDWLLFFSEAKTNQPDRKQVDYNLSFGYPDTDPFSLNTQLTARSWSQLYDRNLGQKLNVAIPVDQMKIKLGMLHESKKRNYEVRYFQPTAPTAQYDLLLYGIDSIFAPSNFGAGKFGYQEITKPSDRYTASQSLTAAYVMFDVPFSLFDESFRFAGGVRMEDSDQRVMTNATRSTYVPTETTIDITDYLPSMNITYLIDEIQNIRLAYSHTVNRPEFREIANVYFYDFDKFEYVVGDSSLTRAYARNYDVRYEIFPGVGDLFAVSYFYKVISSPIEERRIFTSSSQRTWYNASRAINQGVELELRKNLGFLSDNLRSIQIISNYTRVFSEVPYREVSGAAGIVEGIRQMQGQSPYMVNLSLYYTNPEFGTSVNVLFNQFGSRIAAIGQIGNGDFNVIEQSRGTVDVTITQPLSHLLNGLEAKYTVKNLNNQPTVFTHGTNEYLRNLAGITHSLQFNISM